MLDEATISLINNASTVVAIFYNVNWSICKTITRQVYKIVMILSFEKINFLRRPGVLDALAIDFLPVTAFISEDFPTLDLPAKHTSSLSAGGDHSCPPHLSKSLRFQQRAFFPFLWQTYLVQDLLKL